MLPIEIDQAVRIASVPEPLRRLVRRLAPIAMEIEVGHGAERHASLIEALKLRDLEPEAVTVDIRVVEGPSALTLSHHGARVLVDDATLGRPLANVLRDAATALFSPQDLFAVAAAAEGELAVRAALAAVVEEMLSAPRHEQALATFLAGVTSGRGLGFHRAAVFTKAPERDGYVGQLGVGPDDDADAHAIWESVEADAVTFREQLARVSSSTPFGKRVVATELLPEAANAVALALAGKRTLFQHPSGTDARCLEALDPAPFFVLRRIVARGHVLGLLFADMRFAPDPSVSAERLEALGFFVDQAALVWEARNLIKRVEELARHDALTTLLNRRAFEERFVEERTRAQRAASPLALLMIDLDHFREINNERGHAAGDATLRAVGTLLRSELRALDVAARFGGDEIVVLLPGAGALEAALVARRLGVAAHRRGISLSIGAGAFPEDTDHPDALLRLADKTLSAAKSAGRGRASLTPDTAPLVFAEEDAEP